MNIIAVHTGTSGRSTLFHDPRLYLSRIMGGPNLELFRFGFYLFFPVAALFHYGNPDWYTQHVLPVRFVTNSRA
jgi:hypothetical protein